MHNRNGIIACINTITFRGEMRTQLTRDTDSCTYTLCILCVFVFTTMNDCIFLMVLRLHSGYN